MNNIKCLKCVSIIIPIYHGIDYIPYLLDMIEENYEIAKLAIDLEVEVIFINDSPEIPFRHYEFICKNLSVRYITNDTNQGIHRSRLVGLQNSLGKYVLFLDQDDVISDCYLLEQLTNIKDNDISICNGIDYGKRIIKDYDEIDEKIRNKAFLDVGKKIFPGQMLIRKASIPLEWKTNIVSWNCADDLYLLVLMFAYNCKICYIDKMLYCHVITGHNQSWNADVVKLSNEEVYNYLIEDGIISREDIVKPNDSYTPSFTQGELIKINYKHSLFIRIMDIWISNFEQGIMIESFFLKRNLKNIAVYGLGMLAEHLIFELTNTSVKIRCFFDKKIKMFHNEPVLEIGDPIPEIDAIVITPIIQYREIKSELIEFYECRIISLEEIITSLSRLD